MPQPGVPYRPIIAVPQRLTEINPFFAICTALLFTALDPPSALITASAVLPPVPPSSPKPAPVPRPTQDPGAKDPIITNILDPVPGHVFEFPGVVPTGPLPPATVTPATTSLHGTSDPKTQPNDPTAHMISPTQPQPSQEYAKPVSDPKQSSESSVNSEQKTDLRKSYLRLKVTPL